MKALLDTNIVLDMFLGRAPFDADAAAVWQAHINGRCTAYVTPTTLINLFYIVST